MDATPVPPREQGDLILFGWHAIGALVVGGVAASFLSEGRSWLPVAVLLLTVGALLAIPGAGSPEGPTTRPGAFQLWAFLTAWPAVALVLGGLGLVHERAGAGRPENGAEPPAGE